MSEKFNPNKIDPDAIKSQIDAEADELLKEGELSSFGIPKDETDGVDQKAHIDAMNASQKDQDEEKPDQYKGIPETIVEAEYVDDKQKKGGEKKEFYPLEAVKTKDNAEAEKARKEEIEKCRQEVSEMRKEYLKVDYEKNTALSRVRKFFGNIGKDKQEKGLEQDQEVAEFRAYYDNKLLELQQKIVEDAKERGASDKELADIYIEFRTEQKITLADEHDNVKIEQQEGSIKGVIGEKLVQVSKWYQKLPFKTKIAVSVAFMGVGGGLALAGIGAGTAAASVFAGAVTARRLFSGMTAGVGTSLGLEAWGQKKDKKSVEKEKEEFLKKMEGLDEKEKYELLTGNIKDIAIKDEENSINRIKNQDIKQLAAGAAVGTFIGSGMMADFVKWGFHGVSEHFGWGPTGTTHMPHGGNTSSNTFDSSNVRAGGLPGEDISKNGFPNMGIKDIAEGKSPNAWSPVIEHAPSTPSGETLTIQQGSSIERTLINDLKANHPEIKNPGAAAHRMFLDYMHDNKDNIIKKVGEGEYSKMLEDGMVNVKAGTGLRMVMENGQLKLDDIDGKISHLGHHHPIGGGHYTHEPSGIKPTGALETIPKTTPEFISEAETHPQISQNIEEVKSQIGQFKEQLQHRGDLIREINSTQSEYDKLFEKSVNDDEFTRMNKAFEEKRLGEKLIELKKELLITDENLGKMHENLKNAHESIINSKTSAAVEGSMNASRPGYNGAGVMTHVENQPGQVYVTEDISKTHGNISKFETVSGHFDSSHPLELKSGTVSFVYNERGGIIGVDGTHLPPESLKGVTGRELLADTFDEKMQGHSTRGIIMTDKMLVGSLKIYNELLGQGRQAEANAVLKNIYDTMDLAEKRNGVEGLFDRSKLPIIKK